MTSSNVFSFYDASEIAQAETKTRVTVTDNVHNTEEAEVDVCADSIKGDDVRDEAEFIEKEMEQERNNDAAPTESYSESIHNKEEAFEEVDDARDASIQDDDVRDENNAIEGELEEERNNVAASTESPEDLPNASPDDEPNPPLLSKSNSGAKKNQWLDRANALNEIRMLLKEEIEQDSGEYFVWYKYAHIKFLYFSCMY